MNKHANEHPTEPAWRDPLSLGWQAHRGLLMLRLRWHTSAERRRMATEQPHPPHPRSTLPRIVRRRHPRTAG